MEHYLRLRLPGHKQTVDINDQHLIISVGGETASEYKESFVQWPVEPPHPHKPPHQTSPIPAMPHSVDDSKIASRCYHDGAMPCAGVSSGRSAGVNLRIDSDGMAAICKNIFAQ